MRLLDIKQNTPVLAFDEANTLSLATTVEREVKSRLRFREIPSKPKFFTTFDFEVEP